MRHGLIEEVRQQRLLIATFFASVSVGSGLASFGGLYGFRVERPLLSFLGLRTS